MKIVLQKCLHSYFYPIFSSILTQFPLNVFSLHFSYAYPTESSTTLVQATEKKQYENGGIFL